VVEDLWMWLLVAIAVWQATGGKRPI
jgi:hypothetical protein